MVSAGALRSDGSSAPSPHRAGRRWGPVPLASTAARGPTGMGKTLWVRLEPMRTAHDEAERNRVIWLEEAAAEEMSWDLPGSPPSFSSCGTVRYLVIVSVF